MKPFDNDQMTSFNLEDMQPPASLLCPVSGCCKECCCSGLSIYFRNHLWLYYVPPFLTAPRDLSLSSYWWRLPHLDTSLVEGLLQNFCIIDQATQSFQKFRKILFSSCHLLMNEIIDLIIITLTHVDIFRMRAIWRIVKIIILQRTTVSCISCWHSLLSSEPERVLCYSGTLMVRPGLHLTLSLTSVITVTSVSYCDICHLHQLTDMNHDI